jgi:holo-[acyl-carrier protein] synthase
VCGRHADWGSDPHPDRDPLGHTDGHSHRDTGGPDGDAVRDAECHSVRDAECHAVRYAECHAVRYAICDAECHADSHTDPDARCDDLSLRHLR